MNKYLTKLAGKLGPITKQRIKEKAKGPLYLANVFKKDRKYKLEQADKLLSKSKEDRKLMKAIETNTHSFAKSKQQIEQTRRSALENRVASMMLRRDARGRRR